MTWSAHKYLFGRTEKNGEIWIFKIIFLPQKHYLILILLNVNELIIDFFDKSFDNFYTLKWYSTTEVMLEKRPKISLEMEKLNRIYDPLLSLVDVIFFSKEYALSKGYKNKTEFVQKFQPDLKCLVILRPFK